ncbi:MAG: prephenate dehydrogenase/arogenate dehydrogenase family protein [Chitinivibrionales bacterium]|nr:prephenate dehydrogenase/arogenate dehydrogenase family protein [Chitinivibrionales bacterium]
MTPRTLCPHAIGIYSVGLLGGSIGLALRASGFDGKIVGFSSCRGLDTARKLGCIDQGYPYEELADQIDSLDMLFLCSPISVILDTLAFLSTLELPQDLIVTDVGSTKTAIVAASGRLPEQVSFIGGHPMAGSEKSGPAAADPYLFQNAVYVVTVDHRGASALEEAFARFITAHFGCRAVFVEPHIHDEIVAAVSHVPHLLAVALVNEVATLDIRHQGTLELAAGGFRDLTRIASSPYTMWHDIYQTNKPVVSSLLDTLLHRLQGMREALQQDTLQSHFDSAADTRSALPSRNKGYLTNLREILVVVADRPGVIASISSALSDRGINIKDIEVLKIREGEGGTIRLGFASDDVARCAIDILQAQGFNARERS